MKKAQIEIIEKLALVKINITKFLEMFSTASQYNMGIIHQDLTTEADFTTVLANIVEQALYEHSLEENQKN
jgi:hypothetical protein